MSKSADMVVNVIKGEIAKGLLRPGDQLEEAALAERFGISRTPVREAVRSMVDCGLLETRSRKGAFVRCLSAKEVIDLFEVAAELEAMACRTAAVSLTTAHANAIEAANQKCAKAAIANNVQEYAGANLAFHRAIHHAAGNLALLEQLQQIELRINAYRSLPYDIRGRLEKSSAEHTEIATAILSNESELARDLMHDHMMLQGQRLPLIVEALADQPV
ncbi:MAG: GntR family transcriptional regulator [Pseudomonadota bacterium]